MITQTSQQKYIIPLTYIEYADGIYSLLTKNEQPLPAAHFVHIYTLLIFRVNRYIVPKNKLVFEDFD